MKTIYDKLQTAREIISADNIDEVRKVADEFADKIGRRLSIRGGGCYAFRTKLSYTYEKRVNNGAVKLTAPDGLDAFELYAELEHEWNRYAVALTLLEEEIDQAYDNDDDDAAYDASEAYDDLETKALEEMQDVISRWLEAAQDEPWDQTDEEIMDHLIDCLCVA